MSSTCESPTLFYVQELRCFRLGGTRFYSDAGIDGMLRYNETILAWVGAENVELLLRKVDVLPAHIANESAMLLQIDDLEKEFVRLKNASLASGAKMISESLLDTPHGSHRPPGARTP